MANTFTIKQGDTSPILNEILQDPAGAAIDLTGATVRFHAINPYGVVALDVAATVVTPAAGLVSYAFDGTLAAGTYQYEFEVTYADTAIETFPNEGFNDLVVDPSGA